MKKRNQLVSALLAGMLYGSTAVAVTAGTPVPIVAEEMSTEVTEQTDIESEKDQQTQQEAPEPKAEAPAPKAEAPAPKAEASEPKVEAPESQVSADSTESASADQQNQESESDSGTTDSGSSEGGSSEGGSSDSGSSEGGSSEGGSTDSGSSEGGSTEGGSTDSGTTDSGTTDSGTTDSGTTDSGTTDSGTTDSGTTDSGTTDSGTTDSGSTDSGTTDSDSTDSGSTEDDEQKKAEEEAKKKAEEEAKKKAEEEAKKKAEEEAKKKAEEEAKKKAEEEAKKKAEEEAKKKAEEEAKKKAEEERRNNYASYAGGSYYGSYSGASSYYAGTYFVNDTQRRLSLNLGFKQVAKKYAIPFGGSVSIREGKSTDAKVVGILESGYLCYILEDSSSEWVYVESGTVRGFVLKSELRAGKNVDRLVETAGEENMKLAIQKVDPLDNAAYRYTLTTTQDVSKLLAGIVNSTVSRSSVVEFAKQFVGSPYVWGGSSLTKGVDCSGFTQQIYAHFGISIPRTSEDQSKAGVRIAASEAKPGDLLFYQRDGVIYHVLMYIGDGKAISAQTVNTGVVISDVDYSAVSWGCRFLTDAEGSGSSTQASTMVNTGRAAYDGDEAAREQIIATLAKASEKAWQDYGFCRSVLIAQTIEESGWCAFHNTGAGIQSTDNNILGMNTDLLNSKWKSPWNGASVSRLVPQYSNGSYVYDYEDMRVYPDVEACMEDYAAFKIGLHPELRGVTDVDTVIAVGLKGYATNPNYQSTIRLIIDKYNLTQYDTPFAADDDAEVNGFVMTTAAVDEEASSDEEPTPDNGILPDPDAAENTDGESSDENADGESAGENADSNSAAEAGIPDAGDQSDAADRADSTGLPEADGTANSEPAADEEEDVTPAVSGFYRVDNTEYSQEQMEFIWAVVAEEDDLSYNGALAVISAVMNRADCNYGGYGMNAYSQLIADGQYACSPSVADPIYYERRLNGNVPDYVKTAVDDCLKNGVRSHDYNTFAKTNETGDAVQIGSNWYFNQEAPEEEAPVEDNDPWVTLPEIPRESSEADEPELSGEPDSESSSASANDNEAEPEGESEGQPDEDAPDGDLELPDDEWGNEPADDWGFESNLPGEDFDDEWYYDETDSTIPAVDFGDGFENFEPSSAAW